MTQSDLPPAIRTIHRDKIRSGRKREVRSLTISVDRLPARDLKWDRAMLAQLDELEGPVPERPKTRSECATVARPCLFVSCKYNLYVDVNPMNGAIKLNFPDLEPCEMGESCALDLADQGGMNLEDVGAAMNLTRERIRQYEVVALRKMAIGAGALADYADGDRTPVRAHQEDE